MTNTKPNQRSQDVLIWTDIETTGLDPERDVVLEVGMIATDYELQPIDGVKDLHLVVRPSHAWLRWRRMSEFARHMHARNRLLDECLQDGVPTSHAALSTTCWLSPLYLAHGPLTFAGSSVGFDRSFINRMHTNNPYADDPAEWFGHRVMDVSVLDMLAEHLYPDVYAHRPERTTNHRVMACLNDSMTLYRYYRERLLPSDSMAADVWDEGHTTGVSDGLHNMRNTNPYRKEEA